MTRTGFHIGQPLPFTQTGCDAGGAQHRAPVAGISSSWKAPCIKTWHLAARGARRDPPLPAKSAWPHFSSAFPVQRIGHTRKPHPARSAVAPAHVVRTTPPRAGLSALAGAGRNPSRNRARPAPRAAAAACSDSARADPAAPHPWRRDRRCARSPRARAGATCPIAGYASTAASRCVSRPSPAVEICADRRRARDRRGARAAPDRYRSKWTAHGCDGSCGGSTAGHGHTTPKPPPPPISHPPSSSTSSRSSAYSGHGEQVNQAAPPHRRPALGPVRQNRGAGQFPSCSSRLPAPPNASPCRQSRSGTGGGDSSEQPHELVDRGGERGDYQPRHETGERHERRPPSHRAPRSSSPRSSGGGGIIVELAEIELISAPATRGRRITSAIRPACSTSAAGGLRRAGAAAQAHRPPAASPGSRPLPTPPLDHGRCLCVDLYSAFGHLDIRAGGA